jgi:hypothetical protein
VSFRFLAVTGVELLLVYPIIAGVATFLMKRQKAGLYFSFIGIVLLFLSLSYDQRNASRQKRLVVFNTGKANHIELIEGKKYATLYQDTGTNKKTEYAIKPARIMWHAWHNDSVVGKTELVSINGKQILILNKAIDSSAKFKADYVIINYTGHINAENLKKVFAPKLVVLGNNYSRWQQERWKQRFAKARRAGTLHCTGWGIYCRVTAQ